MNLPKPGICALFVPITLLLLAGCGKEESEPPPSSPFRLHATLPSVVLAGVPVPLLVSAIDERGLPGPEWTGQAILRVDDPRAELTAPEAAAKPRKPAVLVTFHTPGIHRGTVTCDTGEAPASVGPVRVVASEEDLRARSGGAALRVYWGDAHGHSDIGDGVNPPRRYFWYAREIAHLNYTCLSEHDFQQFISRGLDTSPDGWDRIAAQARAARCDGFTTFLGWEWSSRVHGHRVIFFPDDRSRFVSYQEADTPAALAEALRGTGAFSVIAHPVGSRLTPTIQWDSVVGGFDRLIEIYSGHGTMDGDPDFRPTSDPAEGRTAVDALRRGLRLSFAAFSDTHLSTPGNPSPPPIRDATYPGGLTAVIAKSSGRADLFEALRDGRTYATSGERFLLDFRVGDRLPGETLSSKPGAKYPVRGFVAAEHALRRVELMAGGKPIRQFQADGHPEIDFAVEIGPLPDGTAVWLRGESVDGERFWVSPVWIADEMSESR
ncbi:MAG: CehA/McbA family metallohydrolase [Gemmatimonadota bacterium]|nr:hypothetical protein [Gemmatimonadota bacterium]MDP6529708.1 CehA/McbA family metallohydrolase [Gemmatimonadota bacterium]MDP6802495.1 CehA/McbA family metallohydrolase [Gemmatimonadota bacterium]MDP7030948.1 CehA/McbA family metallohydrolase [Gemmatimonadota bacterium]